MRSLSRRASTALAIAALASVVTACGASTHTRRTVTTLTPTPSASRGSTVHLVAAGRSCRRAVGQSAAFRQPGKQTRVVMRLKKVYTTTGRLNSYSTAHYPTYGHWVVVPVVMKNLGPGLLRVDPESFVLHAGGQTHTVYDGSGGFSGLAHVLDPTFLDIGNTTKGPLALDSPATHGTVSWEPDHKLACTWSF